MSIELDQEKCIGCGACASVCMKNFAMDDNGKVKVISQEESDCVQNATEVCPVKAITIS